MSEPFDCPSCGAPNEALAGASRMACAYCGANLSIPAHLQSAAKPPAQVKPPQARPAPSFEKEAPDLLRKAQPFAVRAWNTYAAWTWLRWVLPACLTVFVVGLLGCIMLGVLPFLFWK